MHLSKIQSFFYPYRILDIGANIGQFYRECKEIWPDSFVFSIEGNSDCECHLKSVNDNYLMCLLGKTQGEVKFFKQKYDSISTGNSIYREKTHFFSDENYVEVVLNMHKLDDLFESTSIFDLIKIDTQGSELDIISGGLELCKKAKGILLEISIEEYNEGAPLKDEVVEFMKSISFYPQDIIGVGTYPGTNRIIQEDILFLNRG